MRTCDQCGTQVQPFVARTAVGSKRVCQSCVGFKKAAALENPIHSQTGKHPEEWYHGSPGEFEHFGDPADHQDVEMEGETDRYKHWNTLVGNHFTSDHQVAKDFSGGQYSGASSEFDDEPLSHVVHAKLHLKNPKHYASEHDMDQEVYEHEWESGNHHDKHIDPPPEDDDEYEEWAEEWGHRRHYAGDSQHKYSKDEADPNYAWGFHPRATGWLNTHPDKEGIVQRYKDRLKAQGHDGIVYGNEYEGSFHGKAAKSAIALEPHQIEITQHHYGHQGCLDEDEARRQSVHPGQQIIPGVPQPRRRITEERRPDTSKHWPTTWTPSFFDKRNPEGNQTVGSKGPQRHGTGRLRSPLPQECWDRYYGRQGDAQSRTAAMGDPTDWDTHYDPGTEIHRGMVVKVPYGLYDKLHEGPVHEAAGELAERTSKRASTGMHWSADLERARDFPTRNVAQGSTMPVVLHAQVPARESIETRPGMLKRNQVFPHDHHEREVPLRKGSGVEVFGISWKPDQPHPHADQHGWVRHDFTAPVRHTAKSWTMKYTTQGPTGYEDKEQEVHGPLYHGGGKRWREGTEIKPGRKTNPWGDEGPKSTHVYFTSRPEVAADYAEQSGGHVFEVEPTGEFKPDYSGGEYKTKHPLRVVRRLDPSEWQRGKTAAAESDEERRARIQRIREERKKRRGTPLHKEVDENGVVRYRTKQPDFSDFFTPIPEEELKAQRERAKPKPEPIDDRTYSLNDVSRRYDWEGFDEHEISHLVHRPAKAMFSHEDVPVHSLRLTGEDGRLKPAKTHQEIADQDEDEQERLEGLKRGYDQGDAIPPIVVVRHGEHHILADGSHRAAIAAERGDTHIPAFVTERTKFGKTGGKTAYFGETDWDERHSQLPGEVHRGLFAPQSHDVLAYPASDEEIAHGLISAHQEEQFAHHPRQSKVFGTHWTSEEGVARKFALEHQRAHAEGYPLEDGHDCDEHSEATPVVFHAARPERYEIETDPRRLDWQNVDAHDDEEREVPIRHGSPVRITGVSWLKHTGLGPLWHRHDLREPVTLHAEDSDSPDDPDAWNGGPKTAALGEESARQHAGQQDVYAVRDGNSMTMLCQHHADTHIKNRSAADDLGAQIGLSGRERSAEILGEARKGSCAACGKGTSEQLKMMSPLWVRNGDAATAQGDRPRPARRKDKPLRTRPLPSLKQSENIRHASKGDLFHADSGKVRFDPDKMGGLGDHDLPAGAELHHDENEAWGKAIEHWKNFKSDFPRVYVAHEPKAETRDGKTVLSHPAEASELDYDHERHPAIRGHNEESDEPIMYHGSSRDENDESPEEITPSGGHQSFGPGVADPSYAYATPSLKDAWSYAHKRVENGRGGKPTVYRVTPHDPEDVEEDPSWSGDNQTGHSRGTMGHDRRSKKGFEVLDEVPMSQHQEHEWSQSPFNDEAEDDWDEDEHHHGSLKRLADWDDEKPEWCEDCNEKHTSDEGHRECHACGERHEDYEHKMEHEGSWTDWDHVYPRLNKSVHRALEPLSLPDHVHDVVHDESRPMHERASALLGHLDREHGDSIGMHWSDQRGEAYGADKFAGHGAPEGKTQVMLHAKLPERHHIETDPDELNSNQVISYGGHDEAEVPISYGAPVHITGVSWRPGGHSEQWRQHHLKEPMKMTAKRLPTLRTIAHDATENQAIRHCPFCGGGKIIGRADGSVECEFCHNFFTVQIQPQYPNFPQTINGMPQQIPGMPGQVETPGMDGGGFPPDGGDPGMGGGPPWAQEGEEAPTDGPSDETEEGSEDASGEEEPPPFAKQSALPAFRNVHGVLLTEDDYARHLAIRTAADPGAMIARIRAERAGA